MLNGFPDLLLVSEIHFSKVILVSFTHLSDKHISSRLELHEISSVFPIYAQFISSHGLPQAIAHLRKVLTRR